MPVKIDPGFYLQFMTYAIKKNQQLTLAGDTAKLGDFTSAVLNVYHAVVSPISTLPHGNVLQVLAWALANQDPLASARDAIRDVYATFGNP